MPPAWGALGLFDELHGAGNTVFLVTHEPAIAARARRRIRLLDGRVVEDTAAAAGPAGFPGSPAEPTRKGHVS